MPWDDTSTETCGGSNAYVQYYSGTAATSGAVSNTYMVTNVMSNMTGMTGFGTVGVAGWGFQSGYTSVGGYSSFHRGFDPNQVSALRNDFDQVKSDRKRRRAEVKARKLFRRIVGEIRYRRFRERGFHEIAGPSGTRYRLRPGHWVKVMEEDERSSEKIKHLLCAHLEVGIPWYDTMVIQHLMLTSSKKTEDQFLNLANVHDVAGPYPIPEMRVAG